MRMLTDALLARGARTFTLSFHSPSLDVGHTPYVTTQRDLDQFLERIALYCEYFFDTLGGVPATVEEYRASVLTV
jgi:hypothetical protein